MNISENTLVLLLLLRSLLYDKKKMVLLGIFQTEKKNC